MHRGLEGHPGGHLDPQFLQAFDLVGVIGQEADGIDSQVPQDEAGHGVVPFVHFVAQEQVGLGGVVAQVLEVVGPQFIQQADAPALLAQVEDDAAAGRGDLLQGQLQLLAAVAALGAEDVAGEAFGVEPHQHLRGGRGPHPAPGPGALCGPGCFRKRIAGIRLPRWESGPRPFW